VSGARTVLENHGKLIKMDGHEYGLAYHEDDEWNGEGADEGDDDGVF
jgi:hypothetical protein